MKYFLTLLLLSIFVSATAQFKTVDAKYKGFTLLSAVNYSAKYDGDIIPIIAGTVDSLAKKKNPPYFGILYHENVKNLSKVILAELFDGETNKSLRKITLEEFLGKENANWKSLEINVSAQSATASFQFSVNGKDYKFTRTLTTVTDRSIPSGKNIRLVLSVESSASEKLYLKFFGKAEGAVVSTGSILRITSEEPTIAGVIVCNISSENKIEVEKNPKKKMPIGFTITGTPIQITSQQKTELLSMNVIATSIPFKEHVNKQADNIQDYFLTKRAVPELAVVTVPNKNSFSPGDTVEYTIYYHNIGTAPATDVTINNPIPKNTGYLENSAVGEGSTISFTRDKVSLPKIGAITSVSWNFKEAIYPGEERSAKFKVILK